MKNLIIIFTLSCLVVAPVINAQQTRTEKDLLGEKQIPADAYYGVQTARALENFKLSGILGAMKPERLAAIEKATAAIRKGKYHNVGLELTGHKKGEYQ